MIPLKALIRMSNVVGPEQVERYNGFLAAKVLGSGKPGVSSGQGIAAVERVAAEDAARRATRLRGPARRFQEKRTGSASIFAFGFAIVMVYLILAALYERWRLPAAVVLAVPFAVFGALAPRVAARDGERHLLPDRSRRADRARGEERDPDRRVRAAGPARGHAADRCGDAGRAAALPADRDDLARFRARRAAARNRDRRGRGRARRSMGTGVVGGMLAATFIATIFVPLFFVLLARRQKMGEKELPEPEEARDLT